jgi:hypothetical protein
MIEQLHKQGWMTQNKEIVPEEGPEEQALGE